MAMERWRKAHLDTDDAQPFALVNEGPHGVILGAVNDAARDGGAKPSQRLTDARAICPSLAIDFGDQAGDARQLTRLARWAQRWSPWSAVDGVDGLLLDTTGSDHCFGGEAAMLEDMRTSFGALGFTARIAAAPTIGAAWALAHYGKGNLASTEPSTLKRILAQLPIESLRIDDKAALLLRRLGLKTIGSLADIPTTALARRFRKHGNQLANPLQRLQQALGNTPEVVEPLAPKTIYRATQRVVEPVQYVAIVEPILADLASRLCSDLESAQRGLRRVRFEAFRVDGHIAQLQVETAAPVRAPDHIVRLFTEKLERLDAGFGFDTFALTALWHEAMDAHQKGLEEDEVEGITLPHLLDRLRARLGHGSIALPTPYASHIPERSLVRSSGQDGIPSLSCAPSPTQAATTQERPIRLFDYPEPVTVIYATPDGPPRRFRWRRRLHDVAKAQGPERIAPEWWREKSTVRLRDYYKVEDQAGRRFWMYRNGVIDDGRGAPPDWFMHGLFA